MDILEVKTILVIKNSYVKPKRGRIKGREWG